MDNWQYIKDWLEQPRAVRAALDKALAEDWEWCQERVTLLDGFFSSRCNPVDIAIILYGGLDHAIELGHNLTGNNLLFFRPRETYGKTEKRFLDGTPCPAGDLLIFEDHIRTGKAMVEVGKYFENLGYKREKMFLYLAEGYSFHEFGSPLLDHIDTLLF